MVAQNVDAETNVNDVWLDVSIKQALQMTKPRPAFRCVECHGRVIANKDYSDGAIAQFQHEEAHLGCSRAQPFGGTKSNHPNPLD